MEKSIPYPADEYRQAIASETADRAYAFLGIRETICGIECEALTPRRVEWLRLFHSPFIVGGSVTAAEIARFIWMVSKGFTPSGASPALIFEAVVKFGVSTARGHIDEYLGRAYLDSSHRSARSAPMVSSAAYYAHSMAGEPYRMNWRDVLETPLAVLHQLLKARQESIGEIVANKRSDKVRGDWLSKQQALELKQMKRNRRKTDASR